MKTKNKPHVLIMMAIVALSAAAIWSCNKDDDPSLRQLREDKLAYLEDSLRISDSLTRINAAGVVNYAITVVDGSTSTIFKSTSGLGREQGLKSVLSDVVVTISQFGKTLTDTTDASGLVVFNGFFRSAVNITIQKADFTTASYIAAVSIGDSTRNASISFVGSLIPIFPTTGPNTATVSGRATIQTDLTNKNRELAPNGTTVIAAIDALNPDFSDRYLTTSLDNIYSPACGCDILHAAEILQASYDAGSVGTVNNGDYTITVPAAIDGLPLSLTYSEIAADQTFFELDVLPIGIRAITVRAIYGSGIAADVVPAVGAITVTFNAGSGGAATEVIASPETVDRINVTNGGSGYSGVPVVEITAGGGTGATATASVSNGVVSGITLTNPGTGYTTPPTVSLISGTGATATSALQINGTVTGVNIVNSGFGYVTAPTVTFSPPAGGGITATGTANLDISGRVISVTITNPGTTYNANPTVTFTAAPVGGTDATGTGVYSGQSVSAVTVTAPGNNYTYAPAVTFSAPQRSTGTRATGTALIDLSTRQVIGIQINSAGSGYTAVPTVTMDAGSLASTVAVLSGGSIISANITAPGAAYTAPPTVRILGDGVGATATAVVADGKLVGINITNGGAGYTGAATTIAIDNGAGAQAVAVVGTSGSITGFTIINGGANYNGPPAVTITAAGAGGGAIATATVLNGQVNGLTLVSGGSGYVDGNFPASAEGFTATKTSIYAKPNIAYISDAHYGTGDKQR